MTGEHGRIEERCGGHAAELMHPIRRRGRQRVRPHLSSLEQHVNVPNRKPETQYLSVLAAKRIAWIPELPCTRIRHSSRGIGDVAQSGTELRYPHDVGAQPRILFWLKQLLLYFGCTPKAIDSGRAYQHQEPNFGAIRIEEHPERSGVRCEHRKGTLGRFRSTRAKRSGKQS